MDDHCIRLVLLDDQVLFRAGIAHLLAAEPGFQVVGECGSAVEAMEVLKTTSADVVLVNFDLGVSNGTDGFMSAARAAGFRGRFLVVAGTTALADDSARALKQGASGIFLKTDPPERLVQAIRHVAGGALWLDQGVVERLADRFVSQPRRPAAEDSGLNDREQQVLLDIVSGLTNKKIAAHMGLSEGSVKNVLQSLFAKAGVRTRSQLVRVALEGSFGSARFAGQSAG